MNSRLLLLRAYRLALRIDFDKLLTLLATQERFVLQFDAILSYGIFHDIAIRLQSLELSLTYLARISENVCC